MKTSKQKKPKQRNIALYFVVPQKPPFGSGYAEGRYKLKGKELQRQLLDQHWIESSCPLKEFQQAVSAGHIVPEVPV